jgi:hypothetical protein
MRRACLAILFIILISSTAFAAPLKFAIVTNKPLYFSGDDVICKMYLKNLSTENVTVNTRFLVNWHTYSEHEVLFYMTGPGGREIRLIPVVFAGMPGSEYYKTLKPGGFVMEKFNLSKNFNLKKKGKYKMYATYYNQYKPCWTGLIESNTVEFEVM